MSLILGFALIPFPIHHPPTQPLHISTLTPIYSSVQQIKQENKISPELPKAIEPAKEVPVPVVTPPPAETPPAPSGGCVTGYSTGIYALDQLISHESGGRSCAENAGGCFGLLQACPGYPLKAACGGDPVCQIEWFTRNKLPKYGSWDAAWSFWQARVPINGQDVGNWW